MLNFPPPWSLVQVFSLNFFQFIPELINWWQQTESLIPAKLSNFVLKLNIEQKRNLSFFFCCKNSFVLKINKSHWNLMEIFLLLRGNKLRTLELLEGTWSNIRICTETSNTTQIMLCSTLKLAQSVVSSVSLDCWIRRGWSRDMNFMNGIVSNTIVHRYLLWSWEAAQLKAMLVVWW